MEQPVVKQERLTLSTYMLRFDQEIPATFIQYASDILADTSKGLSGSNISRSMAAYAVEYNVDIPHPSYPFDAPNKRTALYENLRAFLPSQQYRIIKELCNHYSFSLATSPERNELKVKLITTYSHLDPKDSPSEVNETLVEETRHWLSDYPNLT